jgi:hypothetical protein
MSLTAAQHSQIATAYEKAAADEMVPPQQRAGFARKANYFRLLARLAAKQEEALRQAAVRADAPEHHLGLKRHTEGAR